MVAEGVYYTNTYRLTLEILFRWVAHRRPLSSCSTNRLREKNVPPNLSRLDHYSPLTVSNANEIPLYDSLLTGRQQVTGRWPWYARMKENRQFGDSLNQRIPTSRVYVLKKKWRWDVFCLPKGPSFALKCHTRQTYLIIGTQGNDPSNSGCHQMQR